VQRQGWKIIGRSGEPKVGLRGLSQNEEGGGTWRRNCEEKSKKSQRRIAGERVRRTKQFHQPRRGILNSGNLIRYLTGKLGKQYEDGKGSRKQGSTEKKFLGSSRGKGSRGWRKKALTTFGGALILRAKEEKQAGNGIISPNNSQVVVACGPKLKRNWDAQKPPTVEGRRYLTVGGGK